MRIFTLTLSPAFDNYCYSERFALNEENLVQSDGCVAGGKGINITRALFEAQITSTAIALLGKDGGEQFERQVTSKGIKLLPIWCDGKIRENITVATPLGETRISFAGPSVEISVLKGIFDDLQKHVNSGDVLTVTGRLPQGITAMQIMPYLKELNCKGILLVIDSKSFTLADLLELSPWLIKPNEQEVVSYCSKSIETLDDALLIAKELHNNGIANVMISLGYKGAVLVNEDGAFACKAPSLTPRSTVGAGDSSIAGFLAAHYYGQSSVEKLKLSVAFGSAACLTESSLPPRQTDIQEIYKTITPHC